MDNGLYDRFTAAVNRVPSWWSFACGLLAFGLVHAVVPDWPLLVRVVATLVVAVGLVFGLGEVMGRRDREG